MSHALRTIRYVFLRKAICSYGNNVCLQPARTICDYDAMYERTRDIFKCMLLQTFPIDFHCHHSSINNQNILFLINQWYIAKKLPKDVNNKAVFACNELDLEEIQVYGFDYDYTLACYKQSLHYLLYDLAVERLIKEFKVSWMAWDWIKCGSSFYLLINIIIIHSTHRRYVI